MKKRIILLVMLFFMLLALAEIVYVLFSNPYLMLGLSKPDTVVTLTKYTIYMVMNGMIIGIALIGLITFRQSEKIGILLQRDEKNSINTDEKEAKIKVLEEKIKTLEKALENAIKSKE